MRSIKKVLRFQGISKQYLPGSSLRSSTMLTAKYPALGYCAPTTALAQAGRPRTFFNLGNFLPSGSNDNSNNNFDSSASQKFKESIVLPYSAEELYAIVSDVDSYKQFLPYCVGSRVLGPSQSARAKQNEKKASKIVDAELAIGFSALRESYVSEVSMRPNEWVHAQAKPSPLFHELQTTWHFTPLPPAKTAGPTIPRTEVSFTLTFAFSSQLYAAIAGQVFEKLSSRMIDAFRQRAQVVYGIRRA